MERNTIEPSRRFGVIFLALMAIAITCAAPASAAPTTKIFERTLPLRAGGSLSLTNVNGFVQIVGWEKEEVEIRALKTALNDPQDIERVTIDAESDGDSAAINTIYPRGNGVAVTVDYRIHVPERVLLDGVETVNGDVHVARIAGAGELASVNGTVEVLDSAGRFSAKTTNGDVRLELKGLPKGGPMQLATVNGSVILSLPSDAAAEMSVVSRNGDFHCDFPLRSLGAYNPRVFRGELGAGGGEILLTTVNGAIRVVQGKPVI
jgi:putative adhesin